jgi:O-antigen/teichoic acid export membrane protein
MSLTSRAALTAGSQALLTGSSLLAGLLVTPLVLARLGTLNYGVWCMLLQIASYASLFDFGNSTVMKVRLASMRATASTDELRREVGAAAMVMMFTFPVFTAAAGALSWYMASHLEAVPAPPLVVLLLLGAVLVDRLTGFYANVLFGANLEYRGTFSRTIVGLCTSAFDVVLVSSGAGMTGMASVRVATAFLLLALNARITHQNVAWFGISRPDSSRLWRSVHENATYLVSHWGSVLTESVEIVLVGSFCGPTSAATYVLTTSPARMALMTLGRLTTSGNAGLGDLLGRRNYAKVCQLRSVSFASAFAASAVVGTTVVVLNASFLTLWVGRPSDLGLPTLLLFFLFTTLLLATRINQGIWMAALHVSAASWSNFVWGAAGVVLGAVLAGLYGIPGLLAGLSCGRLLSFIHSERHVSRLLGESAWSKRSFIKPMAIAVTMLACAARFADVAISDWISLGVAATAIAATSVTAMWWLGFDADVRNDLIARTIHLATNASASWKPHGGIAQVTVSR